MRAPGEGRIRRADLSARRYNVLTTLVLGGARSGKSAYAESLLGGGGLYLATGQALDDEMAARIAEHRQRRGPGWTTIEEPLDLADCLLRHARPDRPILVDCLTLWISNLMHHGRDVATACDGLCDVLCRAAGPVVLVSNEVGMGLVPDTALGRAFRDAQGRVNQHVAASCQRVVFVAAGLPLFLKDVP
jgi:adenosylcobinamide kinase / adenosylcobinamide-phosphate guanylyltransferase